MTFPGRALVLSVAGLVGLWYLGAREERRRRELDAQLVGIPVDAHGRVLGDDGYPLADKLVLRDGEVFDRLAFARSVDRRLGL